MIDNMKNYQGNYLIKDKIEIKINEDISLVSLNSIKGALEAVLDIQNNNFMPELDNLDYEIDGVDWQTHKPLDMVVSTFKGCCSSSSKLLNNYLSKYHNNVGFFCLFNDDGNGHITSYFYEDGFYYFIDSIMLRNDSIPFFNKEDINMDLKNSGDFTGYCYKARSLESFASFYKEYKAIIGHYVPFCFYTRKKCSATGLFTLPIEDDIRIVDIDDSKGIEIKIVPLPKELYETIYLK